MSGAAYVNPLYYTVEWIDPKGIATLCWESASEDDALGFAEECAERDRENHHERSEDRVFWGLIRRRRPSRGRGGAAQMNCPTRTAPAIELACGCSRGPRGMAALCETGAALKAETKAAGERSFDRTIKGGAKTALVREFARRRTMFHEHIGVAS